MPWIIGIDEAGYGPNLGPLVMTSVACRVAPDHADGDLWQLLKKAVRRHPSECDGRLLVDDSKLVYSPARGLIDLETAVLASTQYPVPSTQYPVPSTQYPGGGNHLCSLSYYLHGVAGPSVAGLHGECWFTGQSLLPTQAEYDQVLAAVRCWTQTCRDCQIHWAAVRSVVVCPRGFNGLLDRWGSKAAVLAEGLAELLRQNRNLDGDEPITFVIDKHGGRNYYAAMLQHAFGEGMVVAREEGSLRSTYQLLGLNREVRVTFQPRADAAHFCVALASMASKYLREVLMHEFNSFWRAHVPGLKPTAGYPGDAARFLADIRPALDRLGIAEADVWRRK